MSEAEERFVLLVRRLGQTTALERLRDVDLREATAALEAVAQRIGAAT